jgi:hypothetical protein
MVFRACLAIFARSITNGRLLVRTVKDERALVVGTHRMAISSSVNRLSKFKGSCFRWSFLEFEPCNRTGVPPNRMLNALSTITPN